MYHIIVSMKWVDLEGTFNHAIYKIQNTLTQGHAGFRRHVQKNPFPTHNQQT